MSDPILVAIYGETLDDNNRRTLPTMRCTDCAKGLDWVRGARTVALFQGQLWFDDGTGDEPPATECGDCGDDLTILND